MRTLGIIIFAITHRVLVQGLVMLGYLLAMAAFGPEGGGRFAMVPMVLASILDLPIFLFQRLQHNIPISSDQFWLYVGPSQLIWGAAWSLMVGFFVQRFFAKRRSRKFGENIVKERSIYDSL